MKILLDYEEATGEITDSKGVSLSYWPGITGFKIEEVKNKDSGLDYAKAGYTSEDLVKLKASGII